MTATIGETLLQHLRPGDRLQYRGFAWNVIDYSTYRDAGSSGDIMLNC